MTINTTAAHELALYVINENRQQGQRSYPVLSYEYRCDTARAQKTMQTYGWRKVAEAGAVEYQHEFGTPGQPYHEIFGPAEILTAAAELADYYAEHVAEIDRIAAEDAA